MSCNKNAGFATRQIHAGHQDLSSVGPLATPIFQTSTFVFQDTAQGAARFAGEEQGYIYTRLGNPNGNEISAKVADLEGAEMGLVMSSGMGAVSACMWSLLKAGDHLLADKTLYGCTFAYFMHGLTRFGVEVTLIDFADLDAIKASLQDNTAVVYFESETNPDLKIVDIPAIVKIVKAHNPATKIVVDNTFATPVLLRPIELGVDIVLHSATKYLNGHGDVIAGVLCGSAEDMTNVLMVGVKDMTGSVLGPFEAFLINRGLKTLDIRVKKHCESAMQIAAFLEGHPAVKRTLYPGLASHPQHALAKALFHGGFGGMIAFELDCSKDRAAEFINSLTLCSLAVSLGDAETLIEHPASMTHSTYTPEELAAAGIGEGMIRLSVGLEDPEDIIADLKAQLDKIKK